MIGLLGTNPEGWRLGELTRALTKLGVPHVPLYPWLFSSAISGTEAQYCYDSAPLLPASEDRGLGLVYVMSLGFDELQEAIYKLRLLRELEGRGTRVVNCVETIATCRNKVDMTLALSSRDVQMPGTMVTESVHLAVQHIMANRPCVLKPITGLQGRGLILIGEDMREGDVVDYVSWFQARFGKDVIYVQRYIQHPGHDIRALVVGDEVVSKMRRHNPGSWRTNIAAGARPQPSNDDVDELALQASEAVGGEVVGVDILPSVDGEFYVLEVNAFPGWKGLQEVTEVNIAEVIAHHLSTLI